MPPPVPERVANPRIREDRAVLDFQRNSGKKHRATHEDAYSKAGFYYCRGIFPQSVRKAGSDVDLYSVSTYQCSILFNNMGSFNRKSEFWKRENLNKPITKGDEFNVAELSLLREFGRINYAHVILTAEADSLPTDEKELLDDYVLVGCHSAAATTRQSTLELIPQDLLAFYGNQMSCNLSGHVSQKDQTSSHRIV